MSLSIHFCLTLSLAGVEVWPGFVASAYRNEQVRDIHFAEKCRAIVIAPPVPEFDPFKSTLLIIYATPNGNTAEQTLGCQLKDGMDWHFDIQHIAAQYRTFRKFATNQNVVLACVQANNLSWPAWKSGHPDGPRYIKQIVESLSDSLPSDGIRVVLAAHSGGGSFIFGYIDAVTEIPASIELIAFLDANYGYNNDHRHGEKLVQWLQNHKSRLMVLAYDDRNIELDGKKIVGPTGGTFRATNRLVEFLKGTEKVEIGSEANFKKFAAVDGRLVALVHNNPENIILHTRLVGEMNGLLAALSPFTSTDYKWTSPAPPRSYTDFVQPEPYDVTVWRVAGPALPQRTRTMRGGTQIVESLLEASPSVREELIIREILKGNVPENWRKFVDVTANLQCTDGLTHEIVYRVSPDYLMIGSEDDFARIPLTPYNAQLIADVTGCTLPTRKMVDDIYRSAGVKLDPRPLTKDRESLAMFLYHHRLIQQQLQTHPANQLVAGIKKDVVVTNKLATRPDRVAIYGWHQQNGVPIQPLTTVHVDWYVDYSHGIRLIDQWCEVDGKPARIRDILRDNNLCDLLSDEGRIEDPIYCHANAK